MTIHKRYKNREDGDVYFQQNNRSSNDETFHLGTSGPHNGKKLNKRKRGKTKLNDNT